MLNQIIGKTVLKLEHWLMETKIGKAPFEKWDNVNSYHWRGFVNFCDLLKMVNNVLRSTSPIYSCCGSGLMCPSISSLPLVYHQDTKIFCAFTNFYARLAKMVVGVGEQVDDSNQKFWTSIMWPLSAVRCWCTSQAKRLTSETCPPTRSWELWPPCPDVTPSIPFLIIFHCVVASLPRLRLRTAVQMPTAGHTLQRKTCLTEWNTCIWIIQLVYFYVNIYYYINQRIMDLMKINLLRNGCDLSGAKQWMIGNAPICNDGMDDNSSSLIILRNWLAPTLCMFFFSQSAMDLLMRSETHALLYI